MVAQRSRLEGSEVGVAIAVGEQGSAAAGGGEADKVTIAIVLPTLADAVGIDHLMAGTMG
jgi:hypothetical protein